MSKKAKNEFGLLIEMFDKSTQDVINEFLTYYKVSSHGQYINAIYNMLFEAVGKSNLADLTYIDYEKVLKFYNTDGQNERSQDKYRSVFFKYLYAFDIIKNNEGFENIWLKKDCINHFDKIKNRKSKKKYIPVLTFEELEKFREYINMDCEENKEKMKISFLGYMLYYTNCSVSELIKMSAVNYKDGKVISNENKEYEIPNKYKNLFTKNLSDKGYNGFYTINDIISKLGNILGIKSLTPQTIKSAKKQNSICCSLCGEYYLNNLNNWVSVNNKLVCVECSKKLKKNFNCNIDRIKNIEIQTNKIENDISISSIIYTFEELKCKFLNKKIDYLKLHEIQMEIGKLGEAYVYDLFPINWTHHS